MAKFTLVDDKTEVTSATMHVGGKKRLHLAGVGGDRKVLDVKSTQTGIVTAAIKALYDGPKGIWTIDLEAKAKGASQILAKLKGKDVAKLPVTVKDKVQLPGVATEAGLLARLFLSESRSPSESAYKESDAKKGMQWMRIVVENRLKNNPGQFAAKGAKNIKDIVTAKGQFKGFEKYPTLGSEQQSRLVKILEIANNDSDARQEKFLTFVTNAIAVASSKTKIKDPCPTGLYGWRTVGRGGPGNRFVSYAKPLSGNQFYTLK